MVLCLFKYKDPDWSGCSVKSVGGFAVTDRVIVVIVYAIGDVITKDDAN